ncbi:bacterial extracellular solute-binding domain protein [Pseudomonas sp. CFII68]|nr:bacterial extracellular solute-binding domain protein [Pseudomonas sp. CFII68]
MADPRLKDKVVFQSMTSSTFGLHGFLMFNRIQGDSETDVEPGFKAWPNTVGRNVLAYIPSSAKLSEMLQTDEAALFPLTPTQVTALKLKGMPVEYAQPKEGAVVLNVAECAIAQNTQPELAQKLAAFLLTPQAQAIALEEGDQIPSNPNTPDHRQDSRSGGGDEAIPGNGDCRGLGPGQRTTPGLERPLEPQYRALARSTVARGATLLWEKLL